ncbi:MAG: TonB-dependent receptor [Pseudomonadota bacterium]|nr:TonB-dependent receptor [Pseudomonadota bacterium]
MYFFSHPRIISEILLSRVNTNGGLRLHQNETFTGVSWELGVEYDLSNELFTYAKARSSFRSGGFNGSAPAVDTDATEGGNKFDEETVQDIELGMKYEGLLLSRPSRINLAVYHQWVDDVQRIEFPVPPSGLGSIAVTANIPEMEVSGVELEASMLITDLFEAGLVYAYTDAEFTDGDTVLFITEYSYGPVANTPENTWSVWASLDIPVDPSLGAMSLYGEIYSQDEMYFSNAAATSVPGTKLDSYELVNMRFNWINMMGSNFSSAVFGKNLTDEEYFVGGMALGASLGHNAAAVGEPRTYGVSLTYDF